MREKKEKLLLETKSHTLLLEVIHKKPVVLQVSFQDDGNLKIIGTQLLSILSERFMRALTCWPFPEYCKRLLPTGEEVYFFIMFSNPYSTGHVLGGDGKFGLCFYNEEAQEIGRLYLTCNEREDWVLRLNRFFQSI